MKLKIRTKLLLAFGLILLLSSAVNIYGLIQMDVLAGLTTKMYNHPLQVTRAVLTADGGIIKMHRGMKDVALAANVDDIKTAHTAVQQYEQEVFEQFAIVQKWILGKEGAALIAETIQIFRDWAPIRDEVITLMKKGQKDEASAITKGKGAKHVALLNSKMKALTDYAASKANGMYESAQATRAGVIATSVLALLMVIILTGLLGFFIAISIVKSVRIINIIADLMVAGEVTSTVTNRETLDKDEMGDIGRAFYAVADSFKTVIDDIVQVSQGLAKGNLRIMPAASYQGDFVQIKNGLETASNNLRLVVEDIVQVSQTLAEGGQNVVPKAEYSGDFVQIKNALETAAAKLSEATAKNAIQDWLKTGQTQLSDKISGEQDVITLAKNIITFLTTYLKAQVGVFYLLEEGDRSQEKGVRSKEKGDRSQEKGDRSQEKGERGSVQGERFKGDTLKLLASYAYTQRKSITNDFQIGEGLIGQAALEKQRIIVTEIPEDYMSIQSGIGEAVPKQLLVIPFLYENAVKGVIEIGSFHEITEIQLEWLDQVMPNIGIAVNTADSRTQMQALLHKSVISEQ
jgi:methyl-accepting chemotaxis protein